MNAWVVIPMSFLSSVCTDYVLIAHICSDCCSSCWLGACVTPKVCMVSEFVPNGSVYSILVEKRLFMGASPLMPPQRKRDPIRSRAHRADGRSVQFAIVA